MNLINQVLYDLDRQALLTAELPANVRAVVPGVPSGRRATALGVSVAVLAVACVAWAGRVPGTPAPSPAGPTGLAQAASPEPSAASGAVPAADARASSRADIAAATVAVPAAAQAAVVPAAATLAETSADRPRDTEPATTGAAGPAGDGRAGVAVRPEFGAASALAFGTTTARFEVAPWVTAFGPLPVGPAASAPPADPVRIDNPVPTGPVRIEKRGAVVGPAERAETAYRLGAAAQERGEYAQAATAYAQALVDDASLTAARVCLAGVQMALGRADEAQAVLEAGLALAPQQAALAVPLARLLVAHGDLAKAISVLRRGLSGAAPASAEDRGFFAAVLQRADQHGEAIEQFNLALRLAPRNGAWWMGLGLSLAAANRSDAAAGAYRQALAVGLTPELTAFVEERLQQLLANGAVAPQVDAARRVVDTAGR